MTHILLIELTFPFWLCGQPLSFFPVEFLSLFHFFHCEQLFYLPKTIFFYSLPCWDFQTSFGALDPYPSMGFRSMLGEEGSFFPIFFIFWEANLWLVFRVCWWNLPYFQAIYLQRELSLVLVAGVALLRFIWLFYFHKHLALCWFSFLLWAFRQPCFFGYLAFKLVCFWELPHFSIFLHRFFVFRSKPVFSPPALIIFSFLFIAVDYL